MTKVFKLKNGTILLSTEAPGGLYNSDQLREIGAICDSDAAVVKATEDQRLALYVKEDQVDEVKQRLEGVGLGVRNYQDGLHQPVSCLGELCEDNEQDALTASLDITEVMADIQLESPLKIGINGCATCCVPCHTLDISILGEMNGYKIFLGGKNSQLPEMAAFMAEGVPAEKLPGLIRDVICLYKDNVQEDETLQDVLDRLGPSPFVEALAPYSADAVGGSDDLLGDALSLGSDEPEVEADELNLDDLPDAEELEEAELASEAASDDLALEDDLSLDDGLEMDESVSIDEVAEDNIEDIESVDELDDSMELAEDSLDIEIAEDSLDFEEDFSVEETSIDSDLSDDITLEGEDLDATLAADLGEDLDDSAAIDDGIELEAVSEEALLDDGDDLGGEVPAISNEESIEDIKSISDLDASDLAEDEVPEEVSAIAEEDSSVEDEEAFEEKFSSELDLELQDESLLEDDQLENNQMREEAIDALDEVSETQLEESALDSDQVLENLDEIEKISHDSEGASAGWKVSSINTEHSGRVDLHFSNGAKVSLSSDELENGEHSFEVNGTQVFVSASHEGVCVSSCGIEVVLPKSLAS